MQDWYIVRVHVNDLSQLAGFEKHTEPMPTTDGQWVVTLRINADDYYKLSDIHSQSLEVIATVSLPMTKLTSL